jgi:hypothetical protein
VPVLPAVPVQPAGVLCSGDAAGGRTLRTGLCAGLRLAVCRPLRAGGGPTGRSPICGTVGGCFPLLPAAALLLGLGPVPGGRYVRPTKLRMPTAACLSTTVLPATRVRTAMLPAALLLASLLPAAVL